MHHLHEANNNILNDFDIYPLQNSFDSVNGNKPIKCNIHSNSSFDKDRTFKFNIQNKRFCYLAAGDDLVYDLQMAESGTLMAKVYSEISSEKQFIFDLKDTKNHRIALLKCYNSLYLYYIGEYIDTGIDSFRDENWLTVGISFDFFFMI